MKLFVTVLALAAVFAATEAGPQGRITFGNRAAPNQFRFQVGISQDPHDRAQVFCGGSLISNNWVLTAAHCVVGNSQLTLRLGTTNFTAPKLKLTIPRSEMFPHEAFEPATLNNDIALIRTPYIEFTYNIHKVSLPSMQGSPDLENETVIGSGWGNNEYGYADPFYLKYAYMRIMSPKDCKPLFPAGYINKNKLCATTDEVGSTCNGDSGGPLVLASNKQLVGISSFVTTRIPGICTEGQPAGFVNVKEYLEWIASKSGVYRP